MTPGFLSPLIVTTNMYVFYDKGFKSLKHLSSHNVLLDIFPSVLFLFKKINLARVFILLKKHPLHTIQVSCSHLLMPIYRI